MRKNLSAYPSARTISTHIALVLIGGIYIICAYCVGLWLIPFQINNTVLFEWKTLGDNQNVTTVILEMTSKRMEWDIPLILYMFGPDRIEPQRAILEMRCRENNAISFNTLVCMTKDSKAHQYIKNTHTVMVDGNSEMEDIISKTLFSSNRMISSDMGGDLVQTMQAARVGGMKWYLWTNGDDDSARKWKRSGINLYVKGSVYDDRMLLSIADYIHGESQGLNVRGIISVMIGIIAIGAVIILRRMYVVSTIRKASRLGHSP